MKRNFLQLICLAFVAFGAVACSNPAQMAKDADLVNTKCDPAVLEVVANNVVATYTMEFPEGYFHPKAILEVVPALVYEGGESVLPAMKLQGEKIDDNYKVITLDGGAASHTVSYAYKPGMEVSHLELRCTVLDGEKRIEFPAPYKVADGANTTYMLVSTEGTPAIAAHNYQAIIPETEEAQILYSINSANVRNSELTKAEIKAFQAFLTNLKADERRAVVGTDIVAYASPDGPEKLNNKLSEDRSKSAQKAYDKVTRKNRPEAEVNVSTIGEDWAGFQELVNSSSVEDKELILRVLSMYSDPAVREREIKNMSAVYTTLANKILPQLRRARFITNIEFKNYTDDELKDMIDTNMDALDEEACLYAATLTNDAATKAKLYANAAEKFNSARAYNNLAVCYLNADKNEEAANALAKADANDNCVKVNKAVIAIRKGNNEEAAKLLAGINTPEAKANAAVLDILNGKYADAAAKLDGQKGHNATLANILTDQLGKADKSNVCKCADAAYFRAIVAARQGKAKEVAAQLDIVKEKSPALAARAAKDIEFAKYR